MDPLLLGRLQFAIVTVYHFFFVPLTLGLGIMVALMQTAYYRTNNDAYKRMTKFWGKLFVINFAMGVVTGIVQEFQFGMNWSEYSRFMGDIFGAPLAIEALLTFFLESVFIGVWLFGWDRISKGLHLTAIWCVSIGSLMSAFWILVANSFMQEPVGYALVEQASGAMRAEMVDFPALILNPHVWVQFPHVITSGMATAAFFIMGISAWHLLRKTYPDHQDMFLRSFRWATIYGLIAVVLVSLVGHSQMQHMAEAQPMKVAAAEGLWETDEDGAGLSLLTIGTLDGSEEVFSIRVPYVLSILAFNDPNAPVQGMNNLQADYEEAYGEGVDYSPPVAINYWSFRIMVGAGMLMLVLAGWSLLVVNRKQVEKSALLLRLLPWAIVLPYIANSTGWLLAEIGRQPWIVFGLLLTADSASPNVTAAMVLTSLIAFTLLYGLLMVADIFLLNFFAKKPDNVFDEANTEPSEDYEMAF